MMLEDLKTAPDEFKPTNFWSSLLHQVIASIHQYGIASFRDESAITHFVPHYTETEKKYFISAIEDYRIFLAADSNREPFLNQVSESSVGNPTQHYVFDNKHYSRSFLNYLRGIAFLKKFVDTSSIRRVLEIGGGYGTLGELFLKSNFDRYCYIDIDIPPVAFVATRYLQKVFGADHILDYSQTRQNQSIDLDTIAASHKCAVMMPWQIPSIRGSVDLFVNFFSFQEMEPPVVRNYASFVDRCKPRYLLLRNQRGGKQIAEKPGVVGVLKQTTREHYLEFFSNYECLAIDSAIFGCVKGEFESEVMIFRRK
ncbi:MAG: putative sugar O-methyltransferase [Pseudomonadota bacterium]